MLNFVLDVWMAIYWLIVFSIAALILTLVAGIAIAVFVAVAESV